MITLRAVHNKGPIAPTRRFDGHPSLCLQSAQGTKEGEMRVTSTKLICVPRTFYRYQLYVSVFVVAVGVLVIAIVYSHVGKTNGIANALPISEETLMLGCGITQWFLLITVMAKWSRSRARFRTLHGNGLLPCANCDYVLHPSMTHCSECGWNRVVSERIWDRFMKHRLPGRIVINEPRSENPTIAVSYLIPPRAWWVILPMGCAIATLIGVVVAKFL